MVGANAGCRRASLHSPGHAPARPPSVDELLREPRLAAAPQAARGRRRAGRARARARGDQGRRRPRATSSSARWPSSSGPARRACVASLNATGVVVHTNLGRAPLAEAALARVLEVGRGYSNLEYDLAEGARGSRQDHVADVLRRLTGAEAALVVNNNAAAMLLALAALAEGREVVVSRGELIEIGDGFRIPDVLARSGATARRGRDDEPHAGGGLRARGRRRDGAAPARAPVELPRSSASPSSRRVEELARVARRARRCRSLDDLGSGALDRPLGRAGRRATASRAGADLVCFSGDKLLGGPQAGIVVGRAELVERLRRHPLQRALRADKLTLAALEGTLALYLDAPDEIPVVRMLREPAEAVRARAERLAAAVGGEVEETVARAGGGALPLAEVASWACAVEEELARARCARASRPSSRSCATAGRCSTAARSRDAEADEVAAAVVAARG